ncbi:unnamed protein product, partial [Chrysoparadoxa australica]
NRGSPNNSALTPPATSPASLYVIMLVVLVGDMARGVMFPTLWPYVQSLGGTKVTQGYCVAAFSLGRFVVSPWLGQWSVMVGYKRVLVCAQFTVMLGTLMYALAGSTAMLISAQILMGFGSGTLGVTRGYVADKTPHEKKTYMLAYLTAVQYAGFTCFPISEYEPLMLPCFFPPHCLLSCQLNAFTAPAFVEMACAGIASILLLTIFVDGVPSKKVMNDAGIYTRQLLRCSVTHTSIRTALLFQHQNGLSCYHDANANGGPIQVLKKNVNSVVALNKKYLPSPVPVARKQLDAAEAGDSLLEKQNDNPPPPKNFSSTSLAELDEEPCSSFLKLSNLLRPPCRFDAAVLGGFVLNMATKGTISCFECLGAAYAISQFDWTSEEAGFLFSACGAMGVLALVSMRQLCKWVSDTQLVLGGMLAMMASTMLLIYAPPGEAGKLQFQASVFLMYSLAYPIGHTAVIGLFSKVVGKRPQAALMGWFGSAAGSVARVLFPITAGMISQYWGVRPLFLLLSAVL